MKGFICDAQYLTQTGLKSLFSHYTGFSDLKLLNHPDLILEHTIINERIMLIFDYATCVEFSCSELKKLKQYRNQLCALAISDDTQPNSIIDWVNHGVDGFLHKRADKKELFNAIDILSFGGKYYTPMVQEVLNYREQYVQKLTEREIQILDLIKIGKGSKAIADELHLSVHTIHSHRKNLIRKLQLNSYSELIVYAVKRIS